MAHNKSSPHPHHHMPQWWPLYAASSQSQLKGWHSEATLGRSGGLSPCPE